MRKKRQGISPRTRFRILERDGFTCVYCGRSAPDVVLHVDHVLAVARGGTNDDNNLQAACKDCNAGKAARAIRDRRAADATILDAENEYAFAFADPLIGCMDLTI